MNRLFLILLLFCSFSYTLSGSENRAFVNFISNVKDTTIFLDGKNIGKTPIKQYEVIPNKKMQLKAVVDKNYYNKDIKTTITINNQTIPTFSLKFQKATTKIFFVGDNAELYNNDKFIKKLNDTNRVVTIEASKDVKIKLQSGEADVILHEDIKA
ncbi:MAG: PEGA domain-containing protein, partial [Arcobacteraceae bacterium]